MPAEVLDALGPWGQLGVIVGVVSLVITGFVRGWIFTKWSVEWQNKHLEARLVDRDATIAEQKATIKILMETNAVNGKSIQELVEIGRTSNAALKSLPRAEVEST